MTLDERDIASRWIAYARALVRLGNGTAEVPIDSLELAAVAATLRAYDAREMEAAARR